MKKKQIISGILSIVMAFTVCSIPAGGFAAEEEAAPDMNAPAAAAEEPALAEEEAIEAEEMEGDENPDVAAQPEAASPQPEEEPAGGAAIKAKPEAGGGASLKATNTQYSFVIDGEGYNEYKKLSNVITYNIVAQEWLQVRGDNPSTATFDAIEPTKTVWTNSSSSVVDLSYSTTDDEVDDYRIAPKTFTQTFNHDVLIIPKKAGMAVINVDVYDRSSTQPVTTLTLRIFILDNMFDAAKYEPYVDSCRISYASYDKQTVFGTIPSVSAYNKEWYAYAPQLSEADLDNLSIKVTVGGKTYDAVIDKKNHKFTAKFQKVSLGTKVTTTFKMGRYEEKNRDEDIVVTKWINPKVKVKNYTYDGKWHEASATVTYGGKTLGRNHYGIYSDYEKNVGRYWYELECGNEEDGVWGNYRFKDKDGYFKINPRGTSLKGLKKDKKAITVNWKKQSKKMSVKRVTGYQIQLATSKNFTKNKKLVTVKGYKNTTKKVKKLKKKTRYYVRVRTYMKVGKYTYYSKWSKAKSVTTGNGTKSAEQ